MPGSLTTPGRPGARDYTRPSVLPSAVRTASAPGFSAVAAQWLAYALPYRRFAHVPVDALADPHVDACARLGADAARYSFIVADFHRLLLAGLTGARELTLCAMIDCAKRSREMLLPRTATFPAAVVVTLWCVVGAPIGDVLAGPPERVEFEGASQRLISGGLIRGDRIQGYLAKPEGAGPFPAVVGLHGCAGMPATTKRKLVDELFGWGYVVLLVDSFATRGIEHACTGGFSDIADTRRSDAYGALAFLARQTFVDPHRVAAVGFSQGGWVILLVAEAKSFELFVRPSNWRFRAVVAFYPLCKAVVGRLMIPTLILIGALDQWTPAADCSAKLDTWRTDGVPIEQVVYPGVHHSFYYQELQPGRTMFNYWVEYNEEAATDASRRMREFLNRHLN